MCQVNYQGIHLLTIKQPNIWQGSLIWEDLTQEEQQRLPCETYSRGYVEQTRYYELQLVWEYTWVPSKQK